MKRYFLSMLILFTALVADAQSSNEHMKFMGIPMVGTVQSFAQKLEARGLQFDSKDKDGNYYFNGTFFNEENCHIYVGHTANTQQVYQAGVSFSPDNTWEALSKKYFRLKEALTKKYGEPSFVIEEFAGGEPSSDKGKFRAIDSGVCQYRTQFTTEAGWIFLTIVSGKVGDDKTFYVHLLYVDKENEATETKNAYDDL